MTTKEKQLHALEDISRFLFKGDYDSNHNVKPKAFTPAKGDFVVSVYRLGALQFAGHDTRLSENEIWDLAAKAIGIREHKGAVVARTDFLVEHVEKADVGLMVVEHTEDHQRHAHIQPFPVLREDSSEADQRRFYKERETLRNKLVLGLKATLSTQDA
jgi:hypothetical protein